MSGERPRLLCITGQSASGKSSLAMALAEATGAELLSIDSMQVYRGFDAGTAKPTSDERERVVHHGIDLVDPEETFSAGAFLAYARDLLAEGRRIIAVGGTGLYLRAMLHGLGPQVPADLELRGSLRASEDSEPGWMHRRLQEVDPATAARLHPNDRVRLERALEVHALTGEPISAWHARHGFPESPFDTWLLGIRWPREELVARIADRVDAMLASGWADEVRGLLAAGVTEELTPMRAIGYREVAAHLRGELDEAQLRERIVVATRRFAKRQTTWFNREPSVEWFDPDPHLADRLLPRVRSFLAGS